MSRWVSIAGWVTGVSPEAVRQDAPQGSEHPHDDLKVAEFDGRVTFHATQRDRSDEWADGSPGDTVLVAEWFEALCGRGATGGEIAIAEEGLTRSEAELHWIDGRLVRMKGAIETSGRWES